MANTMLTQEQHRRAAETLVADAKAEINNPIRANVLVACALVHATLAGPLTRRVTDVP